MAVRNSTTPRQASSGKSSSGRRNGGATARVSVSAAAALSFAAMGLLGVHAWADEPTPEPVPTGGGEVYGPPAPPPPATPGEPSPAEGPAENAPAAPVASPGGTTPVVPDPPAEPGKEGKPETEPSRTLSSGERLLGPLGRDLMISGGIRLTSRQDDVTGGQAGVENYRQQNGYDYLDSRPLGPFQNHMDLTIQGKILDVMNVNARLSNSRYGNYYNQTYGLNYSRRGTSLDIGDVNATLAGNELVTFSRLMQGIQVGRDFGGGKMRMRALASLTRAVTQRSSFRGQGTSGPYYLNSSTIIEGSEKLRLNGQDLRNGVDYSIEYMTGQLNFLGGRILTPEDTVEYSYEAQNSSSTPGLLTGMRWDFAPGGGFSYGVTYMRQQSTAQRGPREIAERFAVVADITYRYQLAELIEPGSEVAVFWLDQRLVEGVDYVLNRDLRFIQLRRALPPDTALSGIPSLRIHYRPIRQSGIGGNRSVMGLDTSFRLGNRGNMLIHYGRSEGETPGQNGSGLSMTANLSSGSDRRAGRWSLTTSWRDVGAGFSTIDSVAGAFLRAEKGLSTALTYSPSEFVNLSTSLVNSRIANQNFGYYGSGTIGTGTTTTPTTDGTTAQTPQQPPLTWSNNRTLSAGVQLNFPNLPMVNLNHSEINQTSDGASSSRSVFSSDQLTLNWQASKMLSLSSTFSKTAARGRSVFSGFSGALGGSQYQNGTGSFLGNYNNNAALASTSDSSSTSSRYTVQLTPAAWLSLTGNLGFASTRYGAGVTGTASQSGTRARDTGIDARIMPLPGMTLTAGMTDSWNGQSTAGFYGTGTTGTGTAGQEQQQSSITLTGQRSRGQQFGIQYQPWEFLTLSFDSMRQLALIPGLDNTENNMRQFGFSLTAIPRLQLFGSILDQNVTMVGGQGNSSTRNYQVTATAGPFGKMMITSTLNRMSTGSLINSGFGAGGGIYTPGVGSPTGSGGLGTRQVGLGTGVGTGIGTGVGTGIGGVGTGSGYYGTGGLGGNYGYTGYMGGYAQRQNILSWSTRVDYPLGKNRSLYFLWNMLDSRSPLSAASAQDGTDPFAGSGLSSAAYYSSTNYRSAMGTMGLDIYLTDIIVFSLNANLINLNDRDDSRYSYKAKTFNANLSMQF